MSKRITHTEQYMGRLKRLPIGKSLALTNGEGAYTQQAIWRHAARKLGQSVSIKTMPDGVRLYRLR